VDMHSVASDGAVLALLGDRRRLRECQATVRRPGKDDGGRTHNAGELGIGIAYLSGRRETARGHTLVNDDLSWPPLPSLQGKFHSAHRPLAADRFSAHGPGVTALGM
jgi:hypothetical protein